MCKKGGKKRFSMDDVDFQDSYTYDMDDEYGYSGDKKDKRRNLERVDDYGYHDELVPEISVEAEKKVDKKENCAKPFNEETNAESKTEDGLLSKATAFLKRRKESREAVGIINGFSERGYRSQEFKEQADKLATFQNLTKVVANGCGTEDASKPANN